MPGAFLHVATFSATSSSWLYMILPDVTSIRQCKSVFSCFLLQSDLLFDVTFGNFDSKKNTKDEAFSIKNV